MVLKKCLCDVCVRVGKHPFVALKRLLLFLLLLAGYSAATITFVGWYMELTFGFRLELLPFSLWSMSNEELAFLGFTEQYVLDELIAPYSPNATVVRAISQALRSCLESITPSSACQETESERIVDYVSVATRRAVDDRFYQVSFGWSTNFPRVFSYMSDTDRA